MSLPFLKIAATEIVSGVSGESEEKIRDLFEQAMVSDGQTCIPTTQFCPLLNIFIFDNNDVPLFIHYNTSILLA